MGKFDEIFDDVVVNAKACVNAVSQKAGAVYDLSKLKITASEIRGEINQKLRSLGAVTYKIETSQCDSREQVTQLVGEISDLKDNLTVIEEQIAAAKDRKRCPGCGSLIPKNSVFCNICGVKLDKTETNEGTDENEA